MAPSFWALEELRRWRSAPSRFLLWLAPLVATAFCLGVYADRTVREMPVAVVDMDRSGLSRALSRDMDATPQIHAVAVATAEEALDGFRHGWFRAVVILPSGMDREVRSGRAASVVCWRDATNPMAANQLYSALATIVATESSRLVAGRLMMVGLPLPQAKAMALPLRTDPRAATNPSFDYLSNFAPALFPVLVQMALMLAAGTMLPAGWKKSASPRTELVGRSVPWISSYGLVSVAYYGWLAPRLGAPAANLPSVLALMLLLCVASLLTGAVFGRLVQSPVKAAQYLLAFNTPAFPLSGYTFPEWAMPDLLRRIASPLPFSLFVDAYRGLAGWSTSRPIAGWLGLLAWAAVSIVVLSLPGKGGGEETETVSRPDPVTGGFAHALLREYRRLTRTPGLATMFLAAPVIYLFVYGAMYKDKEERRIPLAIVDGGPSSLARQLKTSLAAHPQIGLLPMSRDAAALALAENQVRGILEVPSDLGERMRRREATAIPLVFVADRFLPANDLQRSVGEVLASLGTRERQLILQAKGMPSSLAKERASALVLDDRAVGNPRETYGDFMLPLLGILILHQLCLVGSAFASAASAGAHRVKDFTARVILFTGWYGLWLCLWVGLVLPSLSVPLDVQPLPLVLLSLLGLMASALMGSVAGMVLGQPGNAAQLLAFTSYPFFFASGASWPREMFPGFVRLVGDIVPLSPWITAGNRAMRLGAGFAEISAQIAHLGFLAAGWAIVLWFVCRFLSTKDRGAHRSNEHR